MPEGPSIVILKEAVQSFKGERILAASGNTQKIDIQMLAGQRIRDFKSYGKQFLICFGKFTIRIHFMLYGSYLINDEKDRPTRLSLIFEHGKINFYACSVKLITQPLDEVYDWSTDVMNERWDAQKALVKVKGHQDMLICDVLLDQNIFAGVGNIIKNEVLFRVRVHPESLVGKLPVTKLKELISASVQYSFDFLSWKREFTLKKHYLAYRQSVCPRDHHPFHKVRLGKLGRWTFYCDECQKIYH